MVTEQQLTEGVLLYLCVTLALWGLMAWLTWREEKSWATSIHGMLGYPYPRARQERVIVTQVVRGLCALCWPVLIVILSIDYIFDRCTRWRIGRILRDTWEGDC